MTNPKLKTIKNHDPSLNKSTVAHYTMLYKSKSKCWNSGAFKISQTPGIPGNVSRPHPQLENNEKQLKTNENHDHSFMKSMESAKTVIGMRRLWWTLTQHLKESVAMTHPKLKTIKNHDPSLKKPTVAH